MKSDKQAFYIEHEYNCVAQGQPDGFEITSQNGTQTFPIRPQPGQKTVVLDGPPPILEVSQLNTPGAVEVYALLFESAYKDRRFDKRKHLPWTLRSDTGATSEWSVEGLARQLRIGKAKVGKAIDALLDAGFIRVLGYMSTGRGSKKRLFQVLKYNQLESYREALAVMPDAFGKTSQKTIKNYLAEHSPISDQMLREEELDSVDCGWDPQYSTGLHESYRILGRWIRL